MAFIVEDGTGKIDANSYSSVEYADAYFLEREISVWATYTTAKKQAALILATDYIEARYSSQLIGFIRYPDPPQALSFPRIASDTTTVIGLPINVVRAACEYALRQIQGTALMKDIASDANASKRVKIGSIETEVNTARNIVRQDKYSQFTSADLLIKPYLKYASGVVIR